MLVPGTQSTAQWKQVHYSNMPFYMSCMEPAQELIKTKTNHSTSTRSFLFLLFLSNPSLLDKITPLKLTIWDAKRHTENCSVKILGYHVASTKALISCPSQSYCVRGKQWEPSLEREYHNIWHPVVCAGLDICRGGEMFCRRAISTCISNINFIETVHKKRMTHDV